MEKKIRFALTCACILLPLLLLCLHARFDPMAFADGEAPNYIWNKEKTTTAQEKQYDVIILGDSVANAGYLPAVLSDRCLNLALGGTTPMQNYYTLKEWLAHNPAPKVCYISFMDFHFRTGDTFWTRSIYTHRHPFNEEIEMLASAVRHDEPTVLTDHYLTQFIEFELGLPNRYMTAIVNAHYDRRRETNQAAKDRTDVRGGVYIGGTKEYAAETEVVYDSFPVRPLFDEYYRKLIELCLDHGIMVRLIKMPLPDNAVFTDNFKKEFYGYYAKLHETFPGITVAWMGVYEKGYFCDAAHMNPHGGLRFSSEIREKYPEDFGEYAVTPEQMDAVNTYISEENDVGELFRWMRDKKYTAIVCDGTGYFPAYYREAVQTGSGGTIFPTSAVKVENPEEEGGFKGQVLSVPGRDDAAEVPFTFGEGTIEIAPENGGAESYPLEENRLRIVVIDQVHNTVVFSKSFRWQDGEFVL